MIVVRETTVYSRTCLATDSLYWSDSPIFLFAQWEDQAVIRLLVNCI